MKQYRVLFNPLSGDGAGKAAAMHLMELLPDNELRFYDITKIDSVPSFLAKTDPKDTILVAGGDGTLRRFSDAVSALPLRHTVYYYATGRDNDFWRDLGRQPGDPPVPVSRYLAGLPTVRTEAHCGHFIGSVTVGEAGSSLFSVTVTVDGATYPFPTARFAAVTCGKYCRGGLLTPGQERLQPESGLTVTVLHDTPRFGTAGILRALRTGNAARYPASIAVLRGQEITLHCETPLPALPPCFLDGDPLPPAPHARTLVMLAGKG